jgi:hypothetical protein
LGWRRRAVSIAFSICSLPFSVNIVFASGSNYYRLTRVILP